MNTQAFSNKFEEYCNSYFKNLSPRLPKPDLPRYTSIPRYIDENELILSYADQCEMALRASDISLEMGIPVRPAYSPIGELNCYLEEILDGVLDEMNDDDESSLDDCEADCRVCGCDGIQPTGNMYIYTGATYNTYH